MVPSPAYGRSAVKKGAVKATTEKNTYATPDFAFPQTVAKNAGAEFEKARRAGDGLEMLRAAIQLDIAASQISADSFPVAIRRFEETAASTTAPWSNLALLLEARLYRDIYRSKPYIFDSRTLPATPVPDNVMEWSAPMFAKKVSALVGKSMSGDTEAMASMPLDKIKGLLTDAGDAVKAGFSVLDFMTLQGCELLSSFGQRDRDEIIPFGTSRTSDPLTPSENSVRLVDQAIERHMHDSDPYILAFFFRQKLGMLSGEARKEWLGQCMDKFGATRYGAPFVADYCRGLDKEEEETPDRTPLSKEKALASRNSAARKKYELLTGYRKRFPDADGIGEIESMISRLCAPEVSVSFGSQLLPERENVITVSGSNLYDSYILVYRLKGKEAQRNWSYADIVSGGTLVEAIPVKAEGNTPDAFSLTLSVKPLAPGYYTFIPSRTADASGILQKNKKAYLSTALVSGLSVITTQSAAKDPRYLFVVSAINQKPVSGARVTVYPVKNGNRGVPSRLTTDTEGKITLPDGQCYYMVDHNGSFISGSAYNYGSGDSGTHETVRGGVLTDLSVYHPGDKVGFTAVTYIENVREKRMRAAEGRKFRVFLRDANYRNVDSLDVAADAFGRFDGSFSIPATGLLGNWNIEVSEPDSGDWVGGTSIQVADYRIPTFRVTLDSASDSYQPGDTLTFNGMASTYSGMPVAGGKVAYTVRYQPLWWRHGGEGAKYGGEASTGADGSFSITLPTLNLRNTPYATGSYIMNVTVTDPAGETQEAPALRFSMGQALRIASSVPRRIEAGSDSLSFKVSVYDMSDHPVIRKVYYDFSADGKSVLSGDFNSPVMKVAAKDLPSGSYRLRLSLDSGFNSGDMGTAVTDSVTVWRTGDKVPPVKTALWVPQTEVEAPQGAKNIDIPVGSSFDDSWILACISDSRRFIRSEWLRVSDGFVKVRTEAPAENERIYISLMAERDLVRAGETVTVTPARQNIPLKIEAESFRDRVTPGAAETWRFRFSYDGMTCPGLPAMAVMSDKALDAVAPFRWAFNPYGQLYWTASSRLDWHQSFPVSNSCTVYTDRKPAATKGFMLPAFDTYGYSLYSGLNYYGGAMNRLMVRGARANDAMPQAEAADEEVFMSVETTDMALSDGVTRKSAVKADAGYAAAEESTPETTDQEATLRQTDCPLAFFRPALVTDKDGVATVNFTVPDFVGTWQFQIVGYTPEMKGSALSLDAISSKKVMAQLNAPRFVRTGDRVSVAATLYNNTDAPAMLAGRLELADPVTGETLHTESFSQEPVAAAGSRTVSVSFDVPSGIDAMTIRVYALIPGFSDGEQTVIPVLPSSAPVVESTPFYIAPGSQGFSMTLPKLDRDAKVTLTYCDNPVWECVTALPSILKPESVNILAQAEALFGNAVAAGLFGRYPVLGDALRRMADPENAADSALYSPLEKNAALKTVMLANTPWVNNAASETMRMQSLTDYADPAHARTAVEGIMKRLKERQNKDGGWSWCPDMKSSAFMTGRVLHTLALLADMGYLPDGGAALASKACGYMERELAEEWNRNERKYFSLTELLSYLYDRSSFGGIQPTSQFRPLEAAAVKKIQTDWRTLGVADKATAAMLLERRSLTKDARLILESLRQTASVSPEKGMWFDNLSGVRSGDGPLLATARVLEAYSMIEPGNPAIDLLRQWLVISRQTQDWGDSRPTAEVINAILTSGTDWTVPSSVPEFYLNGTVLETAQAAGAGNLSGSYTVDLDPATASGARLTLRRRGAGPAWGGVIAQYIAPIIDVKAADVPQLSVTKNIYTVTPGEDGESAAGGDPTTGSRVRVTLTVTCDRDLDYVAVTDPRAACLEPADQLSGYTQSDGVWFYREVRDESTNLFIPFLPKGTHVISYECFADRSGDYSLGIATAQSQYAPEITAHSAGRLLKVKAPSAATR